MDTAYHAQSCQGHVTRSYLVSRVDNSLKLTPVRANKLFLKPQTLFASKPYERLT